MSCPVGGLDEFYTNHWDFETLCLEMHCKVCTADPEDLPQPDPCVAPEDREPSEWDIPF